MGEHDEGVASVNVENFPGLRTVYFGRLLVYPPHGNVVSVGRDISGELITASGILNCDLSGSVPSLMTTTCKISKVHLHCSISISVSIITFYVVGGNRMMFFQRSSFLFWFHLILFQCNALTVIIFFCLVLGF